MNALAERPPMSRSGLPPRSRVERVTTEFAVEMNGVRFPGSVLPELPGCVLPGPRDEPSQATPLSRVRQTCDDCRFFHVRSAGEIGRILAGP